MAVEVIMKPRITNRRTVLTTIGAGVAGSIAFVGTAAAGDHTFAHQLNAVRATTRKYHDRNAAKDGGDYEFFGIAPFVGVIFNNASNIGNLDLTKDPSLLFYAPTRKGEITSEADVEDSNTILVGVEYHVEGRGQGDQNIFADEQASCPVKVTETEAWHDSPPGAPPLTGLHVWAHLQNPDGVFAPQHPTIRDHLMG